MFYKAIISFPNSPGGATGEPPKETFIKSCSSASIPWGNIFLVSESNFIDVCVYNFLPIIKDWLKSQKIVTNFNIDKLGLKMKGMRFQNMGPKLIFGGLTFISVLFVQCC